MPATPRQISKSQFKAQALALFREIETSGEALVITDHGRPALEVRPYRPTESGAVDPLQVLRNCVSHYDDPLGPGPLGIGRPWRDPARHPCPDLVGERRSSQPLGGRPDRD
ncbi:MAG: type II toxin-antitoxin system Phd/YefM family antitoxin [Cyanobium sp.]